MIGKDERLRAIALLFLPAFVGHFIQLGTEDMPWMPWAWPRYFTTPGWHLYISPWVVVAIAVLLALSVAVLFGLELRALVSRRAALRSAARSHPTKSARPAPTYTRLAGAHMMTPASCWSSSGVSVPPPEAT